MDRQRSRKPAVALALAFFLPVVAACGGGKDGGAREARTEEAGRPAAGAPGAAEANPPVRESSGRAAVASDAGEMCAEHGVLEALCTKCNPALVAVFQAKGDWCAEHGLPESICPICHPERGGRPSVEIGDDGSPPDGIRVRLGSAETARLAGIEVAQVAEEEDREEVVATARIVFDATRTAEVTALSPGVVREIRVEVGDRVARGAPLAWIESAGLGAEQSRLRSAESRAQVAEANHERLRGLFAEGIVAERELLEAGRELEEARAERASARAALDVIGSSGGDGPRYALAAPVAGVVVERHATVGRMVTTEEILFRVVDPARMWAEIDIPEAEQSLVAVGQAVSITLGGDQGRVVRGVLDYLAPQIDPHTRTVRGRVALENRDGLLRANMFGEARIAVGRRQGALVIPPEAVQRAREAQLVFVRLTDELYEGRRVRVLAADARRAVVSGRLSAGEEVVTTGSFLLKTETLKESIGAGCCEVD